VQQVYITQMRWSFIVLRRRKIYFPQTLNKSAMVAARY